MVSLFRLYLKFENNLLNMTDRPFNNSEISKDCSHDKMTHNLQFHFYFIKDKTLDLNINFKGYAKSPHVNFSN